MLPATAYASGWPDPTLPDGMVAAPVSSHMIYNGTDMRSQIFTSPQKATDIVRFYRELWGKQSVLNELSGWQIVGHREGNFYLTVQVRNEAGGSRGDIGMVRIPETRQKIELGAGVPHPSSTVVLNDIAYPDDPTPARTLAMYNALSVQQNASYYREHLMAGGWKPSEANVCTANASSCVMNYEQGDRKMSLALTANSGHAEIVINMMGMGVTP